MSAGQDNVLPSDLVGVFVLYTFQCTFKNGLRKALLS